jgi:hypothetical protein
MKLAEYNQNLENQLLEFDTWITAALSEIKDHEQFISARLLISQIIERIGQFTNNFEENLSTESISQAILAYVNSEHCDDKFDVLNSFINFLFLVTGKSDNNAKCQFPVFLKDRYLAEGFPEIRRGAINIGSIPRVIDSERVASLLVRLVINSGAQKMFFKKYVDFLLSEDVYWKSLKAIGLGYFKAKSISYQLEYLLPLVVFQLRGSLSASGGHEPERILRELMTEWGLEAGVDFNITDFIIKEIAEPGENVEEQLKKTRAYDFVLPLGAFTANQKILIQCQFYAGDSGSVSHKNIDQTRAARDYTKGRNPDFTFVEFLDGAGYYSSLNGDLKKLLSMPDTRDFFQLRTAVVKLRRIIQRIGFLTPLEVTHAIAFSNGSLEATKQILLADGYGESEVNRVLTNPNMNTVFVVNGNTIKIHDQYRAFARRYLLLDGITRCGQEFNPSEIITGAVFVLGYGVRYGIKLSEIPQKIATSAGLFKSELENAGILLEDIQTLADRRWIIQS